MKRDPLLLLGPAATVLFALGVLALPALVPGYSPVRQTVSEIGEVGSPAQVPFTLMLCLVGLCLLGFAYAVRRASIGAGRSGFAAWLIAWMAVCAAGVGVFAFPHPLHNVFGISETVGYMAPAAMALCWRKDAGARSLVRSSWLFFALTCAAIAVNLSGIFRDSQLWLYVKPVNGLAQRSLFACWFGWAAVSGILLFRLPAKRKPAPAGGVGRAPAIR
jgi:hypothetical membrane protein